LDKKVVQSFTTTTEKGGKVVTAEGGVCDKESRIIYKKRKARHDTFPQKRETSAFLASRGDV